MGVGIDAGKCAMKSSAKSNLVGKIARTLERAGLNRTGASSNSAGHSILLALSGGPDSVALLHCLRELAPRFGYRLAAAHLNHRLRGSESDRDELFVRELCSRFGVQLVVAQASNLVPPLAPGEPNLEERSREARYAFLTAAAARLGASHIATAHHADDQAETVMLRLLRGAGAAGLGAMAETVTLAPGDTTILRPMLRAWRHEILRYLDFIHADFMSDSSNTHQGFLRNRLRIELLPALERDYAPGLRRRLTALATEMRELDDYVARNAESELDLRLRGNASICDTDGFALSLDGFAKLHRTLAMALLRAFLARRIGNLRCLTRRHIEGLHRLCLGESPSAALHLPGGWRAERRYAALVLERRLATSQTKRRLKADGAEPLPAVAKRLDLPKVDLPLALEGVTEVPQTGFVFHSVVVPVTSNSRPTGLFEACFDADRVAAGLVVRNFAPGDRVSPLGMEGSRKLHDIFIDRKLGRARRHSFPVITLEGQVAWLPGLVRGRIALIGPQTVRVLRVQALEDAVRL
jgi:tRNA(Ile)-lysidine synthase